MSERMLFSDPEKRRERHIDCTSVHFRWKYGKRLIWKSEEKREM
jgi:hypothetical protein